MSTLIDQLSERMAAREAEATREGAGEAFVEDPQQEAETETVEDADSLGEEGATPETEETTASGEIRTVAEFAEAAGWTPEELYSLAVRLDTGEEIPLGKVKDRLQELTRGQAAVQEQTAQLKAYAENLQAQAQAFFAQRTAESEAVEAAHTAMVEIQARFNSVDWSALEKANPGQAALLQQKLAAEYAGAQQQLNQAKQQEQQASAHLAQQARQRHAQALLQAVPEWRDPTKVQAEVPAVQQYLSQWFRPDELASIYDWRAHMLARKAWLYDQTQTKVAEAQQRIKAAPKPVVRPGGPKGSLEDTKVKALVKQARTSGRPEDKNAAAVAVLRRAFGNG